jgi:hypothetical protein
MDLKTIKYSLMRMHMTGHLTNRNRSFFCIGSKWGFPRRNPVFSILASVVIFSTACKKNEARFSPAQSLIANAEKYFTDSVLSSRSIMNSNNPLANFSKSCLWEKAYTMQFTVGKAVIVPVKYGTTDYVKSNFSGTKLFSADNLTKLVIYKDASQNYRAEVVIALPDSGYARNGTSNFSGILIIRKLLPTFLLIQMEDVGAASLTIFLRSFVLGFDS